MKTGLPLLALFLLSTAGALPPKAFRAFICPAPPAQAADGLSAGQKRRMMELTSVFENGAPEYNYGYIENLGDGRGYTAGRVGFCTGTDDLIQVVRLYTQYKPDNPLNKFMAALEKVNGSDSVAGLDDFPAAWRGAAADPEMVCAQDQVVDGLYYGPALRTAASLGIKLPFGKAIIYDAIIMHGGGDDSDGLSALIKRTTARTRGKTPRNGYNERAWLAEFLAVRKADMLDPSDASTKNEWSQNAERADILKEMLLSKTYDELAAPMSVSNSYYTGTLP